MHQLDEVFKRIQEIRKLPSKEDIGVFNLLLEEKRKSDMSDIQKDEMLKSMSDQELREEYIKRFGDTLRITDPQIAVRFFNIVQGKKIKLNSWEEGSFLSADMLIIKKDNYFTIRGICESGWKEERTVSLMNGFRPDKDGDYLEYAE